MPGWVEHAVWWQVYPLGFVGAEQQAAPDQPVVHRLDRLRGWLDYAVELGASGIALGPIFASRTHGYDTLDHYRIDPRLGDEGDFAKLVGAAHERGLRVLLDGVFNHVDRDFPHPGWFRRRADGGYDTFEGHGDLIALDHGNPEVAAYVRDVLAHWLGKGADGWRLDVAHAVPSAFWAAVLPPVRERHPEMYVVGETIHGDYEDIVRTGTLDSVTQYELWKATWSALNDGNLFELSWALERHNGFLDAFAPLTFVGNHDVTRIASILEEDRLLPHALAVLFTIGGTPSVYYGDEQAFRGVKEERVGGDDAIRPAFPAQPDELAPEGWATYRLHQDLIGTRRRHAWLHRARTEVVHLSNTQLAYRSAAGDDAITVALNLDPEPATLPVGGRLILGAGEVQGTSLTLEGYGWAVLE
jgi:cyclomaltodextrinase / maltogenic alpha-amylase / neopullulanase